MSREARMTALEVAELFIAQEMKVEISLDRKLTQVTGIFESELWLDVEIHPAGDGELLFVLSTVGSQRGGPSRTEDIATFDELAHRIAEECRFRRGRVEEKRDYATVVKEMADAIRSAGPNRSVEVNFDLSSWGFERWEHRIAQAVNKGYGANPFYQSIREELGGWTSPCEELRARMDRADRMPVAPIATGGITAAGRALVDSFMDEQISTPYDDLMAAQDQMLYGHSVMRGGVRQGPRTAVETWHLSEDGERVLGFTLDDGRSRRRIDFPQEEE